MNLAIVLRVVGLYFTYKTLVEINKLIDTFGANGKILPQIIFIILVLKLL